MMRPVPDAVVVCARPTCPGAGISVVALLLATAVAPVAAQTPPPPASQPAAPPVPSWMFGAARARPTAPESRRDCVICHLEWADAFDRPGAILLIDRPAAPVVAEQETCLGCHDGSVGDSRLRVWAEHGHRTGVVPPSTMQIPEELPLKDGRVACRTCHTAHGGIGPQTIATIVFLRIPNDASQLCQACHAGLTGGVAAGMHALGTMPWPVPQPLVDAGAKVGPPEYRLICQTCHTAHGAAQEHLLVMGTQSSQLCLTCHDNMRPGMFRSGTPHEHPQNPPLQEDFQRQAIVAMGTEVGPGQTLICLSCHKMHAGLSGRFLLADTLHDSGLCIRCHPQRDVMVGTAHDLRKSAPESRNRLGQTPDQSGPCGACHSFHTFARQPEPQPGDPTGLCGSCHQPEGPAAKKTGQPLSHPTDVGPDQIPAGIDLRLYPPLGQTAPRRLACLTCHDPHQVRHGSFLRTDSRDGLCGTCHTEQALHLAEAHDFTGDPDLKNARAQSARQVGTCGFCHAVHDANGPFMWIASKVPPTNADELCTICHSRQGIGAKKPVSLYSHPTGPAAPGQKATVSPLLPLFDARGRKSSQGFVACGSCHDPHIDKARSAAMLRGGRTPLALCVQCHQAQAALSGGPHDRATNPTVWPKDAQPGQMCLACHRPHSDDPAKRLWTVAPSAQALSPSDAVCVGCHPKENWAGQAAEPLPGQVVHPRWIVRPEQTGLLPVIPAMQGRNSALECKTCHDPHVEPASYLLRRTQNRQLAGICYVCHPEVAFIGQSLHAVWVNPALKSDTQLCGPCHAVHAIKGSVVPDLWAAGFNQAGKDRSQKECLACHGGSGPGKTVLVVQHPDLVLPQAPPVDGITAISAFSLMPHDRITCITCHLPHGRSQPGNWAAGTQPSLAALRGSKPMVRMDVSGPVCAKCHGFDAARRFLYYHKPQMRSGIALPLSLPAPGR
jgi:predicted CXXCH cytochrome family protein